MAHLIFSLGIKLLVRIDSFCLIWGLGFRETSQNFSSFDQTYFIFIFPILAKQRVLFLKNIWPNPYGQDSSFLNQQIWWRNFGMKALVRFILVNHKLLKNSELFLFCFGPWPGGAPEQARPGFDFSNLRIALDPDFQNLELLKSMFFSGSALIIPSQTSKSEQIQI